MVTRRSIGSIPARGRAAGARALLNYLTILGIEGVSTAVTLVARGSSDGKSWSSIPGLESSGFGSASTTPNRVMLVPEDTTPLPRLVQLGLKIEATASLGAARVSWTVEPRGSTGTPALGLSGSATNPTAGTSLIGDIDLLGELDVSFGIHTSLAVSTTVDLLTSGDGSAWFTADTVTVNSAGEGAASRASNLLRYVRLVVRGSVTTTVSWSFKAVVP